MCLHVLHRDAGADCEAVQRVKPRGLRGGDEAVERIRRHREGSSHRTSTELS